MISFESLLDAEALEKIRQLGTVEETVSVSDASDTDGFDDALLIFDRRDQLCGCLTPMQLRELGLAFTRHKDCLRLESSLASEKRLQLLKASIVQNELDPMQLEKVKTEIDEIHSARLGRSVGGGNTESRRYVVRDRKGYILRYCSLEHAMAKWPNSKLIEGIIYTGVNAKINEVNGAGATRLPKVNGDSRQIAESIEAGIKYSRSVKTLIRARDKAETKVYVLYRKSEPLCITFLDIVEKLFGSNWFFVGDDTVQLVLDWEPNAVKRAGKEAGRLYDHRVKSGASVTGDEKQNTRSTNQKGETKKGSGATKQSTKSKSRSKSSKWLRPATSTLHFIPGVQPKDTTSTRARQRSANNRRDELSATLGGVRSLGIRARAEYHETPVGEELPKEERQKIWQPPMRDTSRFSGSSASRHSAMSSYNWPDPDAMPRDDDM